MNDVPLFVSCKRRKCLLSSYLEKNNDQSCLSFKTQRVRLFALTILFTYYLNAALGAVHKVRHAILANFDPPSLCHTLSHIPRPPESTSHISDPPIFTRPIVQKSRTKVPGTNSISIVRGRFCPGWFLSVPPSVTIHLLQQKVKHHLKFMFHMYDKNLYKRGVTCS